MRVRERAYEKVCVCERERERERVCVRERERERERQHPAAPPTYRGASPSTLRALPPRTPVGP